jgi:ABC-type glycerol-3-phosphate transport system permease component
MSATGSRKPKKNPRSPQETGRLITAAGLHLLLMVLALTMVLPFAWMVLTSLKPLDEVGLESWIPSVFRWENYAVLFGLGPAADDIQYQGIAYGRWYLNSLFVAGSVTFLQVFTSSLAAFSFARLRWPGRDQVFLLYLSTMMLPGLVMMIPNYQIMISLGLVDTYWGLIVPAAFSAFGTFLLRQFMLTIPPSLDEAAEIDGASKWRLFLDVILPLSRPGLITLTIFTFIGNYQSFFWPLVMLKSTHLYTLPVGLLFFDSSQGQQTNVLMAAITLSILPMIVVFVVLQKYLVKGIQLGAVKG